jgi:hypothetical protein
MSLIQFTRNHTDRSTDKGYQFEFFCDRCGNGFRSGFKPSAIGMAGSALRTVGNIFGGVFGTVSGSTWEMERAAQGAGHDSAFRGATCWNGKRMLCYDCAPDIETELASAQAQTTVDQMRQKLQEQDLTKGLNLTAEAAALCPACGARTQGTKFCPECGNKIV